MKRRWGKGSKRNITPIPPSNLPAKIDPKAKTSPFEMNGVVYEMIRDYLNAGGQRSEVNKMMYYLMNPKFSYKKYERRNIKIKEEDIIDYLSAYTKYHQEYRRIEAAKKGQASWEILKAIAFDMENDLRIVTSLKRKEKGEKRKSDHKYEKQFQVLDDNIEYICNLIYTLKSNLWIAGHMRQVCPDITPIIFEYWLKETDKVNEIIDAYKFSANQHMAHAVEFMKEWLDPQLHPELGMQHVGLVREIGLYHQRFAEYMDRKRFGKRVEIVDDTPKKMYLEGKDLDRFLEGLDKSGREDAEEGDYEEVKNEE